MKTAARLAPSAFVALMPGRAEAHVKWFSEFSFTDRPLSFDEIASVTFGGLLALSVAVIVLFSWLDWRFAGAGWHRVIDRWLETRKSSGLTVMRVGAFAVLLLCWQADAVLVPALKAAAPWIGWYQFLVALLLLFDVTVPLAGVGLMGVYAIGIQQFGWFHMLDYVLFLGTAYYLIASSSSRDAIRKTALPGLYATVGFSLCWVALEKLVYPKWALSILREHPVLSLGLEPEFFLVAAAFIELSLGYLLIICLLARPMALTITLVFFLTTMVFGKVEVIGHTMIHAALIVFLLEGPGSGLRPPARFHKTLPLRLAFASVNFVILTGVLMAPYLHLAFQAYEQNK